MFWYLALIEVYALSKAWRQRVKFLDGRSDKTICDVHPASLIHPRGLFQARSPPPLG